MGGYVRFARSGGDRPGVASPGWNYRMTESSTSKTERFCPHCDVSMDLHPYSNDEGQDEWSCNIAGQKADLLTQFGRPFLR
jgi:hypothetical protein